MLILMIGGAIILASGVTGLYVGKIFEQVKDRPLFVVDTVWPPDLDVETDAGEHRLRGARCRKRAV